MEKLFNLVILVAIAVLCLTACGQTVGEKLKNENENMEGEVSGTLEFDASPVYEFTEKKRRDSNAIVEFADEEEVTLLLPRADWNYEVEVSANVEVMECDGLVYLIFSGDDEYTVKFPETIETESGMLIDQLNVRLYSRTTGRNK